MSTHKSVEVKISEEVYALVKKMAEAGRGKGRGERVPCTIGEMASDLVSTGAFRRIAANKWAKENKKPSAPRKPKAAKKTAAKKPAKVVKLKTARAKKAKAAKPAAPASSSAAAPAAASVLD